MPDTQEIQLIREATDIFLRLRDNPDDKKLQQERNRFLARGVDEQAAYNRLLQVWTVAGTAKRAAPAGLSRMASIIVAGMIVAGGYWAYDPMRIALTAHTATGFETANVRLDTGDQIALDAQSAFADRSDESQRHINLLRGTAFFDVEKETRPFVVTAGDLRVEVTGTAFEVATVQNGGTVSVTEGSVTVRVNARTWHLRPDDQLNWSEETGTSVRKIDTATAARWRDDLLVSDAMTLQQILGVLDRRLPGEIVVLNETLRQTPIVGSFDLSKPQETLTLLTELTNSKTIKLPYVASIILPKTAGD